jgi:hypothetical protein
MSNMHNKKTPLESTQQNRGYTRKVFYEKLEYRNLLAFSHGFEPTSGELVLMGDDTRDWLVDMYDSVGVVAYDVRLGPGAVLPITTTVPTASVKKIKILCYGGNDIVALQTSFSSGFTNLESLEVRGGSERDVITAPPSGSVKYVWGISIYGEL